MQRRPNMLTVKIINGDSDLPSLMVNDVHDLRVVTSTIIEEFAKVLSEDEESQKERIIKEALDGTGYRSIEDMLSRIETLEEAIEDIYYSAEMARV